jgi:probable O-glycosylation ligase (exosortase A-associated)
LRDIAILFSVLYLVPAILIKPYRGPLAWAWVSMMSPQRMAWGFAYYLPVAQILGITTLLAFAFSQDRKPVPWCGPTKFLLYFYVCCSLTTLWALNQTGEAFAMWVKVTKIQLMLWVTMVMLVGEKQIRTLIWVIALSIGFYGIKGGIFTVLSGGGQRVWGPAGSFIEGNNELALALVVIMPLLYFLYSTTENKWGRKALMTSLILIAFSVLGSQSRGALLAIGTMAAVLGLRSSRPVLSSVTILSIGLALVAFMPDNWSNRMHTITTHEDHSAQSRLYTWQMILNLVAHRPWGAGYDFWTYDVWSMYAVTEWKLPYSPHSIYFQALGEQGVIGFVLYLGIGVSSWRLASKLIAEAGGRPEYRWLTVLMQSIQVSLISFAVGGAFLGLVNFDVPYYLAAIVAVIWRDCRPTPFAPLKKTVI